jgi:hypothetical protein
MQSLRPGFAVAVCSILLGTFLSTAETSPLHAASLGEADRGMWETNSAEVKYEDFKKLVEKVKGKELDITSLEKKAKCPYQTLSFDGVTHVMCDYSQCDDPVQCQDYCRQVYVYMKCGTHKISTEYPGDGDKYRRVYFGCVYVKKAGRQSEEPSSYV